MSAPGGEVLFEFRRLGNAIKVIAVHCDSLTEVSLMVPLGTPEAQAKRLAVQKLHYVLAKKLPP